MTDYDLKAAELFGARAITTQWADIKGTPLLLARAAIHAAAPEFAAQVERRVRETIADDILRIRDKAGRFWGPEAKVALTEALDHARGGAA